MTRQEWAVIAALIVVALVAYGALRVQANKLGEEIARIPYSPSTCDGVQ